MIFFLATSGWDPVTGFGSVDYSKFFTYFTSGLPTMSPTMKPTTAQPSFNPTTQPTVAPTSIYLLEVTYDITQLYNTTINNVILNTIDQNAFYIIMKQIFSLLNIYSVTIINQNNQIIKTNSSLSLTYSIKIPLISYLGQSITTIQAKNNISSILINSINNNILNKLLIDSNNTLKYLIPNSNINTISVVYSSEEILLTPTASPVTQPTSLTANLFTAKLNPLTIVVIVAACIFILAFLVTCCCWFRDKPRERMRVNPNNNQVLHNRAKRATVMPNN